MVLITHVPPSSVGIGSNQYSDPLGIAQQRRWCTMRRIILVLSLAAVMVGALSVSAVGAFADPGSVPGHCKDTDHGTRICAGGSGDSDGGGGGQIEFIPGFPPEELSSTTGGGSNFRGSGS